MPRKKVITVASKAVLRDIQRGDRSNCIARFFLIFVDWLSYIRTSQTKLLLKQLWQLVKHATACADAKCVSDKRFVLNPVDCLSFLSANLLDSS